MFRAKKCLQYFAIMHFLAGFLFVDGQFSLTILRELYFAF